MEVFEITPSPRPKTFPRGFGLCAYSDSGDLFINSLMIGMNGMSAFLACAHDGLPTIAHGKNVLVPFDWARNERPELSDGLLAFKKRADEIKGAEGSRN